MMKPNPFVYGVAVGTGVGALVTVGYFLLHALTIRVPETTW